MQSSKIEASKVPMLKSADAFPQKFVIDIPKSKIDSDVLGKRSSSEGNPADSGVVNNSPAKKQKIDDEPQTDKKVNQDEVQDGDQEEELKDDPKQKQDEQHESSEESEKPP